MGLFFSILQLLLIAQFILGSQFYVFLNKHIFEH